MGNSAAKNAAKKAAEEAADAAERKAEDERINKRLTQLNEEGAPEGFTYRYGITQYGEDHNWYRTENKYGYIKEEIPDHLETLKRQKEREVLARKKEQDDQTEAEAAKNREIADNIQKCEAYIKEHRPPPPDSLQGGRRRRRTKRRHPKKRTTKRRR